MSKVRVRFECVCLWHPPFTLEIEVKDGEDIDDALDREWTSGLIQQEAELKAEAIDIRDFKVLKQEGVER